MTRLLRILQLTGVLHVDFVDAGKVGGRVNDDSRRGLCGTDVIYRAEDVIAAILLLCLSDGEDDEARLALDLNAVV